MDCGSSSRHLSSRDFVYWSMSSQQQPRSRNSKRARVDEEATKEEDQDVRLCAALRGLLGGSKYVKQSELSREVVKLCHPKRGRCACHLVHGDSRAFSGRHI